MSDFDKCINASDLIDWIMCAFPDWCVGDVREIVDHVNEMPSAQPDLSSYSDKLWRNAYDRGKAEAQADIIRCKDCKHFIKHRDEKSAKKFGQEYECECGRLNLPEPDDFCSRPKRKENR